MNECLSKLETNELEKIRKGMIYRLIRKKSFDDGKFLDVTKQDCERTSFKRLAESLKKMFPRLPICLMGDSLYACEPVFEICRENKWQYLIRYKDGSIPTLAEEYGEIKKINGNEEEVVSVEKIYKRKPNVKAINKMKWVNNLDYSRHKVTVMELEIEKDGNKWKEFQWITSISITNSTAYEFSETGRKRQLIENEGFNIQKNIRYYITHANSLNYNAMKNHYLLTQLEDALLQLYEYGIKDIKVIKRTPSRISEGLLECLKKQSLEPEDLIYERMQIRKNISQNKM